MPWGKFKLSQLKLDQQNIRTGPQPDQRAAMKALATDKGQSQPRKLVNLAQDLMDLGPSPGEPIWVTADPDDQGQFIVLEGNRRVCALKMLDSPSLAADTEVAAAFADLAKVFRKKPRRELEAQIFASREDARPWIERRHMSAESGVALQPWSSLAIATQRAQQGKSPRRSLLVLNYLDDGTPEYAEAAAVINAKATTVDRVLNSPALREALGVEIDRRQGTVTFENGNEVAGRRLLRNIITAMAAPDFTFSRVRDTGDRDNFIRRFAGGAVPAQTTATPAVAPKKRLTAPLRPTLAPKNGPLTFNVKGPRLNKLYRECRKLKIADNENAAALLLRVFIELSSEALLLEKNVPIPAKRAGKTDWSEIGITLIDKINTVMPLIDVTVRTKQQLKGARVALATTHASGSIDTLHAYFHNLEMTLDVASIRAAWDTWENYLRLLHAQRT